MSKGKFILLVLCLFTISFLFMRFTISKSVEPVLPTIEKLERRFWKTLPVSFMQAKPQGKHPPAPLPTPYLETLSLSNNGRKLAIWLEPYRWEGRFSLMNSMGDEEIIKDFPNLSLEILFPSFFTEAGDPQYIFWSPDDSRIAFSVRRIGIEDSDKGGPFKKWMTIIFDSKEKSFKTIKHYTTVNVVNPWGTAFDNRILLKKEESEENFSLAILSTSSSKTFWSFTPKNFKIRADEVVARRYGKIYVFEQDVKERAKVWTIDISTKKEQLYLDLPVDTGFRYYSLPSPNLEVFLLIGVPEKYPEQFSGPKTFFEIRELSTGKLIKRLSLEDYWLIFLRWSSDGSKIALLGFNRSDGWLGIWDIRKDKLYQIPTGKWEPISADFGNPPNRLYFLSRENIKECNIYTVDISE